MEEKYQAHRMMYEFSKAMDDPQTNLLAEWLGCIFRAVDEGRPLAYHCFTMFSEVMVALDIEAVCCEAWDIVGTHGVLSGAVGMARE